MKSQEEALVNVTIPLKRLKTKLMGIILIMWQSSNLCLLTRLLI